MAIESARVFFELPEAERRYLAHAKVFATFCCEDVCGGVCAEVFAKVFAKAFAEVFAKDPAPLHKISKYIDK